MSDAETWCRICLENHPDAGRFCPKSGEELGPDPADTTGRPAGAEPAHEDLPTTCWRCGAASAHAANETCAICHQPLVPPDLVIDFPAGSVVLRSRSTSVVLGRAGEYGQLFADHPNVSRRHATVGVDEASDPWIAPFPEAPNGTFVNGSEILCRTAIHPGDRIRFATDRAPHPGPASQPIRQPNRER